MKVLAFISIAFLSLALLACSGDDKKDEGGEGGSNGGTAATTSKWDKSAEFDYFDKGDDLAAACNVQVPIALRGDETCIVDGMRRGGASQQAIDFFQRQEYFLITFDEEGVIDYGVGGAPWMNMGRPTPQLFLNGQPDIVDATFPRTWTQDPTYVPLVQKEPYVFAWGEYAKLTSSTKTSSGGQRMVLEFPLRACRACEDLGYLPVAYEFDTKGVLGTTTVLAFKPK